MRGSSLDSFAGTRCLPWRPQCQPRQWLDHSVVLLCNNRASAQGSGQSLALELVRMSPHKHKHDMKGPETRGPGLRQDDKR